MEPAGLGVPRLPPIFELFQRPFKGVNIAAAAVIVAPRVVHCLIGADEAVAVIRNGRFSLSDLCRLERRRRLAGGCEDVEDGIAVVDDDGTNPADVAGFDVCRVGERPHKGASGATGRTRVKILGHSTPT